MPFARPEPVWGNCVYQESESFRRCSAARKETGETEVEMPDCNDAEEQRRAEIRLKIQQFYAKIETLLKRHGIYQFVITASGILRRVADDVVWMKRFPPHRLIHAIEASCAYSRRHNYDSIDLNSIGSLMNVYHDYLDPLQQDALNSSFDHFIQLLHREQMELQFPPTQDVLGRNLTLFAAQGAIPKTARAFTDRFGLTPFQWIKLSFLAAVAAEKNESGLFEIGTILNFEKLEMTESAVRAYFGLSGRPVEEIGRRFKEARPPGREYFYSSVRSAFLETPFIRLDDERMLAPLTNLIFRHSGHGLYWRMREIAEFEDEIGPNFERYVRRVLESIESRVSILDSGTLERCSPGRSCDFVVVLNDEILFVECKATWSTARDLTENALDKDTSNRKIADGIVQIYTTAYETDAGTFDALGVPRDKPAIGVVVTLGDLVYANSQWFFERFVVAKAYPKLKEPVYPSAKLPRPPIALSVGALERLVVACNSIPTTPTRLLREKEETSYLVEGDWDQFLNRRLRESAAPIAELEFQRESTERLKQSLGI